MNNKKGISRRELLKTSVIAGSGLALIGLSGCTPKPKGSSGKAISSDDITWTEEHDFVIVGAGGALFAGMAAHAEGKDVVMLEKGSNFGGAMFLSAGAIWVPNNHQMSENHKAVESPEKCLQFMKNCDVYNDHSDEMMVDWIEKSPGIFDYIIEKLNVPIQAGAFSPRDYYDYEGAARGRTLWLPDAKGGVANHSVCWEDNMRPLVDKSGVDIRLNTEVTSLHVDDEGRVIGVAAKSGSNDINIKAAKGVLLATGSFDQNEKMVKTYMNPRLASSRIPAECTGDGHRMAMELGAETVNMTGAYGAIDCLIEDGETIQTVNYPFLASPPGLVMVGKSGRRFGNESSSYDEIPRMLCNLDFKPSGHPYCLNKNAHVVCDSTVIKDYGFPGGETTRPSWVKEYDTLEDLAVGEGININNFLDEIQRFNTFCETGVDEDFNRGNGPFDHPDGGLGSMGVIPKEGLKNYVLGPVSEAPFFTYAITRSSLGSSGGVMVNENAQVMKGEEPIPGLYACGCVADQLVSGYPGAGFPISSSITRGIMAVDHALELGIIEK